jgi:hypothetical protein
LRPQSTWSRARYLFVERLRASQREISGILRRQQREAPEERCHRLFTLTNFNEPPCLVVNLLLPGSVPMVRMWHEDSSQIPKLNCCCDCKHCVHGAPNSATPRKSVTNGGDETETNRWSENEDSEAEA